MKDNDNYCDYGKGDIFKSVLIEFLMRTDLNIIVILLNIFFKILF